LSSPGPVRLLLEVVRLLEGGQQQHVVRVILGAIEAVGRIDELAQTLEAHEGGQVVAECLHHEVQVRAVQPVDRGAQKGQVAQERMLVESLSVGLSLPERHVDVVPPLDEGVPALCGDEAVEHTVYPRPHLDDKPRHFDRRGWVLNLLPANVLDVAEQERASVYPDTAVLPEERQPDEVAGMGASGRTVHGVVVECLWEVRALHQVADVCLGAGHPVQKVHSPLRAESSNPIDYVALDPGGHLGIACMPEGPDILVRGDGMWLLKPRSDLIVASKVQLAGIYEL